MQTSNASTSKTRSSILNFTSAEEVTILADVIHNVANNLNVQRTNEMRGTFHFVETTHRACWCRANGQVVETIRGGTHT